MRRKVNQRRVYLKSIFERLVLIFLIKKANEAQKNALRDMANKARACTTMKFNYQSYANSTALDTSGVQQS